MEYGKKELARAFATFLKPGLLKLGIFAVLAVMLLFLPLYPVHRDTYIGPDELTMNGLESSGTSMKSLLIVLEGDYNWTETVITTRYVIWTQVEDYHLSYFDANPAYAWAYAGLGFLAYCAGCYYVESSRGEKKRGQ